MNLIKNLHHVSVLVDDLDRSLEFYTQLLGLKQDYSRPDMAYPGAWLCIGTQQLHLLCLPDPCQGTQLPEHGGRDRHFAMSVSDIKELAKRLENNNIVYTMSKSGRQALFCRDPDGNALEFVQTDC